MSVWRVGMIFSGGACLVASGWGFIIRHRERAVTKTSTTLQSAYAVYTKLWFFVAIVGLILLWGALTTPDDNDWNISTFEPDFIIEASTSAVTALGGTLVGRMITERAEAYGVSKENTGGALGLMAVALVTFFFSVVVLPFQWMQVTQK